MAPVTTAAGIDLDAASAIVEPLLVKAAEVAGRGFRTPLPEVDKGGPAGYDPVTDADRRTEELLRAGLREAFPATRVEGEEGGGTGPDDARVRWVIDPIDGTKAYVTGVPMWGVLLGLVIDDRPVAGWMRQPFLDETFGAVGGRGWYDRAGHRTPLQCRDTTALEEARLYTTHPSMFTTEADRAGYDRLSASVQLQRFGGDCYSYCLLALGYVDLVVEAGLHPHDIVPLVPIVEAAGGVVTDGEGRTPMEGGFVVAAATPALHRAALHCFEAGPGR